MYHGSTRAPRPGRLLPVGQRLAGEQRHLDRARGALAPAAPEAGVEPAGPAEQLERLQPGGECVERAAPGRIQRRLAKQPLGERPHVEPGAAHDDRHPSRARISAEPPLGVPREVARAVARARDPPGRARGGDPGPLLPGRLGGADVEPAIDLAGVGRDRPRAASASPAPAPPRSSPPPSAPPGPAPYRRPNRRSSSSRGSCTIVERPCTSCGGSSVANRRSSSSRISRWSSRLARLDRRAAGVRGREPLEPVGPAAEPAAGQVGHQLPEAGAGVEPRVGRRHRVQHHRPPAERLGLEADAPKLLAVALDGVQLLVGQLEGERQQQPLRRARPPPVSCAITASYSTRSWAECWSTMTMPSGAS